MTGLEQLPDVLDAHGGQAPCPACPADTEFWKTFTGEEDVIEHQANRYTKPVDHPTNAVSVERGCCSMSLQEGE